MKIMGMGLNPEGRTLFNPVEEVDFAKALVAGLERNGEAMRQVSRTTSRAVTFRSEVQRQVLDLGDPRLAGWTYLLNENDPQRDNLERALEPLARHRGMTVGPLLYPGGGLHDWLAWFDDAFYELAMDVERMPHYILIAGGPEQVPFQFQSILSTAARVGRIALDSTEAVQSYVEKILRLEAMSTPVVAREVVLFAPDGGVSDPTYYSREQMVLPLQEHIEDKLGFDTVSLLDFEATKANLVEALTARRPALVYTASHGLGAIDAPLAYQQRYNGAICCQHQGELGPDALFSADDVPADEPFLEGAVFFQFACFGYGTPAQSDYVHWLDGVPGRYAEEDFVAALPKRLLAHPRGPVAYIGHLDTAFLHAFTDPRNRSAIRSWHSRLLPFRRSIEQLLGVQPSGMALQDMNERYNLYNAHLTATYDDHRRGDVTWNERAWTRFVDTWITRSDAQNYMIFGDPAARLRIPSGAGGNGAPARVGNIGS
jgi:hypothetical protein